MGRPPCCDKLNVKRGLWTAEEDAKIRAHVANHGIGNWTVVPQKAGHFFLKPKFNTLQGLNRCGKSCRLRWTNYLRPDLRHDNFTPEEEQLILDYHKAIGSRWSLIAKQLPGRTDNDVKNYWNTKLKKKLCKMGIDPVTHKPISQILSDYGKIRGLPNTRNQIGSLNNSMNGMSILTSEHSYPSLVRTELPSSTDMNNNKPVLRPETNYHSWDNVAKFHSINQDAIQPHFFAEVSSSISSSSSLSSSSSVSFACQRSQVLVTPSSSSSWSEFLLGDPVLSIDMEQKQERDRLPNTLQNEKPHHQFTTGDGSEFDGVAGDGTKRCSEAAASSSANSFVEAILDRDSEMQLEFPEFLTEYLNP